jgi:two-component system response regulator AtoC
MPSPQSPPHLGQSIGSRYAIRRKLGAGSLGTVYLAEDGRARRPVAFKVLGGERIGRDGLARLKKEFRAIASIRHPRIAAAYDFGFTGEGGLPFYTREYIEGRPLPSGPPPAGIAPEEFLRPILDLLDALHYLHSRGILHLDVHAGNLIVSDDPARGSVLIDFGLIRSAADAISGGPGGAAGLPPEILLEERPTPQTDIYLAGRLLLYRLTGRLEGDARLPREIPGWGPALTTALERIAGKALQRVPDLRFRSAREFRDALAAALGEGARGAVDGEPREVTVGREAEIRAIEEALRGAAAGKSAVLGLIGPPGIGKTRLLVEARLRAQLRGLDVVDVGFAGDPGPGGPLLARALRGTAGENGDGWLEPLDAAHGGTPADRARRAAANFFAAPGRPLVLLVDDLDRADRESALLAEALIEEASIEGHRERAVVLIATAEGGGRKRGQGGRTHVLRPLSPRDSRRLLASLLEPLRAPTSLARQAVAAAKGSPLRLRRIARALSAAWGKTGCIPPIADLPPVADPARAAIPDGLPGAGPGAARVLEVLAVIGHPAPLDEIAESANLARREVASALGVLTEVEAVSSEGRGRARRWRIAHEPLAARALAGAPAERVRAIHERRVRLLRRARRLSPASTADLARHLLGAGRRDEGRETAIAAARDLAAEGSFDRAVRLLRDAATREPDPRVRFKLVEEASEILEVTGDHGEGAALLQPWRRDLRRLGPCERVRLLRRLGTHLFRSGRPEEAARVFGEAEAAASPRRDIEDLVFIDSEMAELLTLRGSYEEAEAACRRGIGRLGMVEGGRGGFRGRMEMTLRASLGHLELRRMRLDPAREEVRAAADLAARHGLTSTRVLLLNNLGIIENQLNRFRESRRSFREAERLLARSGDRRPLIEISCNLAVLAAKLGDPEEARAEVERAEVVLRRYPGDRLEFFVPYARAVVASLLGEPEAAAEAFGRALPRGRALGDRHLVGFGEVYLAEAHILCGRYGDAGKVLRDALRRAGPSAPPVLVRMAAARRALLEALLGREGPASRARAALDAAPRTGLDLLEAWNDIAAGAADLLLDKMDTASESFRRALGVFRKLRIPFGETFARLGLLAAALGSSLEDGRRGAVRTLLVESEASAPAGNRLLTVLGPLLRAEAALFLGDRDRARELLSVASGAMVGCPFLELDWWLEFLAARIERGGGDLEGERRHLHRSLHVRDLLVRSAPEGMRRSLGACPRFAGLAAAASRVEETTPPARTGEALRRSGRFEGMVGRSPAMVRVFEEIDRIRRQEMPVLVIGETGTGKELVARAIHATSPRSRGRFIAVGCASLPAELFEAELFGCEAGAFTGADEARPGLIEAASGGTLLLDAVSELPLPAQAKLLRVLDSRVVRRLGSIEARPVDARFIASSSVELESAVKGGRFRADLYFRLRGAEVRIPPLRDRPEDIPLLARRFLEEHAARLDCPVPVLSADAEALLAEHSWPGNVRELEAVILRALVGLAPPAALDRRALEGLLASGGARRKGLFDMDRLAARALDDLKLELEREYLLRLMRDARGDLEKVMERLGVKRSRLYVVMRRAGIEPRRLRGPGGSSPQALRAQRRTDGNSPRRHGGRRTDGDDERR